MDAACPGVPARRPPRAGRLRARQGIPVLNNRQLAAALGDRSEGLRQRELAHIRQHGTLIPHAFMADVLAYVGDCIRDDVRTRTLAHRLEVTAIVECMEQGMAQGDREARNVVALSFARDAENEDFFRHLRPLMGPRLRAQLKFG